MERVLLRDFLFATMDATGRAVACVHRLPSSSTQGMFAMGRLVSIALATRLAPALMLLINVHTRYPHGSRILRRHTRYPPCNPARRRHPPPRPTTRCPSAARQPHLHRPELNPTASHALTDHLPPRPLLQRHAKALVSETILKQPNQHLRHFQRTTSRKPTSHSPPRPLLLPQGGCTAGVSLMMCFPWSKACLIMGTMLIGIFMSSVFPTALSLAEQCICVTRVSPRGTHRIPGDVPSALPAVVRHLRGPVGCRSPDHRRERIRRRPGSMVVTLTFGVVFVFPDALMVGSMKYSWNSDSFTLSLREDWVVRSSVVWPVFFATQSHSCGLVMHSGKTYGTSSSTWHDEK
ncbi:hypothetical protein HPB48_011795 [Haemaphysalis longicornis]|uniref:Uncharacterized protein n=1 Tax=Haemaphysalis longicornis TaxID=44386 RepID=A0A9J6FPK5_HAELO|nr:hypothetical protein HPB48_011795 [Haemaphysalis longicornis]